MKKVYINGDFYTFDSLKPNVQAVVIENGRFVDMGTTEDMLLTWGRANNDIINLEGKTVTPGLIDSHLHLSSLGISFIELNVTGCESIQEMLGKIKQRAASLQPGEWIVGRGWDENLFTEGSIPTIKELDDVSAHNPLIVTRICGHAHLINSKALEVSKYHPDMSIPEGGTIVLDEITKEPTGLVLETASDIFTQYVPEHTYEDLKNAVSLAIDHALQKGITSVHTNDPLYLGGLEKTYQIFDELLNEDRKGLRCNLLINHEFLDDLHRLGMYAGFGNDRLNIGAVKIFIDGAMGRSTAHLSEPYSDDSTNYGDAMYSKESLYEIVRKARALSMPIAAHTIGDQAVENILDVLDQFPAVAHRDRLIHVQVLRETLMKRLAQSNRVADIQPRFLVGDFPWVQERLGEKRTKLAYAWKTLQSAGVICAGGSDAPIEPIDPLLGIHAAVTRRAPGQSHAGWNPQEMLSMYEAFGLFTKMGAYPTNEEMMKGTITRGKYADMTVYSKNPFTMENPDELLSTEIEMTIIGGEIKYRKGS